MKTGGQGSAVSLETWQRRGRSRKQAGKAFWECHTMSTWHFWTEKKASVGAGRAEDKRTGWQGHTRWDLVSLVKESGPDPTGSGNP